MAAQEEAIEESRFSLREVEIVHDFRRNDLWQSGHREKCSLPKRFSESSSTHGLLPPLVQLPVPRGGMPIRQLVHQGHCQKHLTAVGCLKAWQSYTTRCREGPSGGLR